MDGIIGMAATASRVVHISFWPSIIIPLSSKSLLRNAMICLLPPPPHLHHPPSTRSLSIHRRQATSGRAAEEAKADRHLEGDSNDRANNPSE